MILLLPHKTMFSHLIKGKCSPSQATFSANEIGNSVAAETIKI